MCNQIHQIVDRARGAILLQRHAIAQSSAVEFRLQSLFHSHGTELFASCMSMHILY
jgi:hypothetical protein